MSALLIALLASSPVQVSHRRVTTPTGAALALHRFDPPGHGAGRPAVVLLADVGLGRELFDFEGRGLARALAGSGRRVYVAEVRGQGRAEGGGDLQRVVAEDLPALFAAVQQGEGRPVDLVAHGWLGALAMGATTAELKGQVRRVVALSTPVLAEVPSLLVERFLAEGGAMAALNDSPAGARAFELMLAMGTRFPPGTLEAFRATAVRNLPAGVARELLAWMREGDLRLGDGSTVLTRWRSYDRRTLQLMALGDGFSNPELGSPLRDHAPAPVTVMTFSRFVDGDDLGHLSMLLGEGAERRVFTPITRFLDAEDAP